MAIHQLTRKEYRRFIARWRRGKCPDATMMMRGEKVPDDVDEQRHWLRSILFHYGRLAADSGARLFRHRLFGLTEAMPATPRGLGIDPDAWREESHRNLERCHQLLLGTALACRRLLRDLPPPKPKAAGDLFDMLNPDAEPKTARKKKV